MTQLRSNGRPLQSHPHAGNTASPVGRFVGGSTIAVLFMGSTLVTPLYDLYRTTYDLSLLELGSLYAVYVIGNLAALLFLGRLSDQLGRRPVVFMSLALASASALLFLVAQHASWLFAARITSGLAVGLGSGAATAWIAEFTPEKRRAGAASIMTAFNFIGLALGTMVAGLLAQYEPRPLRVPFEAYLVLLATLAGAVAGTRETLPLPEAARIDFNPRIGIPSGMRLAFSAPAAAGFAAMALVGLFAALGPTMLHESIHVANRATAGMVVSLLFIAAALAICITRSMPARTTMTLGLATIPLGVALLVAARQFGSLGLMLTSAAVTGVSAALGYRGGLAAITTMAPPQRRAETASSYFVCCFLGNALPIVGVTALSSRLGSNVATMTFAVLLSCIGVAALGVAQLGHRKAH